MFTSSGTSTFPNRPAGAAASRGPRHGFRAAIPLPRPPTAPTRQKSYSAAFGRLRQPPKGSFSGLGSDFSSLFLRFSIVFARAARLVDFRAAGHQGLGTAIASLCFACCRGAAANSSTSSGRSGLSTLCLAISKSATEMPCKMPPTALQPSPRARERVSCSCITCAPCDHREARKEGR